MLKIPPDETFLYQIGLFLVVWFLLKRFWFTPALQILKERSTLSAGAVAQAQKVQTEVARMRAEHATALEQTRADAQREVATILRDAEVEQRRVVDEANAAAQASLGEALMIYDRTGPPADDIAVRRELAGALSARGDMQGALDQLRRAQRIAD